VQSAKRGVREIFEEKKEKRKIYLERKYSTMKKVVERRVLVSWFNWHFVVKWQGGGGRGRVDFTVLRTFFYLREFSQLQVQNFIIFSATFIDPQIAGDIGLTNQNLAHCDCDQSEPRTLWPIRTLHIVTNQNLAHPILEPVYAAFKVFASSFAYGLFISEN
jgi:hypothetical protein